MGRPTRSRAARQARQPVFFFRSRFGGLSGGGTGIGAASVKKPPTYKACATKANVLTLLKNGKCPKGTHKVTLGAQGPAGVAGPKGDTGPSGASDKVAVYEPTMIVEPAYLQAAYDAVEADYGSIESYLREGLGLDQPLIDALHARLVE